MSITTLLRPEIRALRAYTAAAQQDCDIRLNANEIPWPAAGDVTKRLHRYPGVRPVELRARLASMYGVPPENLLVTRGSSEAIDLLMRTFCRPAVDNIVLAAPTFGMFRVYADMQGAIVRTVPLLAQRDFAYDVESMLDACDRESKLIFVCSPNNPTGNCLGTAELESLLRARRDGSLIVVDEAYAEFSERRSAIELAGDHDNLVVLRTLSKAHGLAGARIGAVIAGTAVIDSLDSMLAPYAFSTPVVEHALTVLTDNNRAALADAIDRLRSERDRLERRLSSSPLVARVWPSEANFLLLRLRDPAEARRRLERARILVREFPSEPGLADCCRVTVGTVAENDRLLQVLGEPAVTV